MFSRKFILFKNIACQSLITTRNYPGLKPGMKHDIYDYIKWVRPEKMLTANPKKSGDLKPMEKYDDDQLLLNFDKSKTLENAEKLVKTKFSIGLNPRKKITEIYVDEMIKKVQRHDLDYGSMEAKLAKMTAKIRSMQQAFEENPRHTKLKTELKELIERRKKFLKHLRRYDYKRFEYILEQLDLKYVPAPDKVHWIARKDAMRTLTKSFCEGIKQERLDNYKHMLQAQQLEFLEKKIKNLEFIRSEQIECKIPVTVQQEQIVAVKKQYEELKKQREEEEEVRRKNEVRDDYEIKL